MPSKIDPKDIVAVNPENVIKVTEDLKLDERGDMTRAIKTYRWTCLKSFSAKEKR